MSSAAKTEITTDGADERFNLSAWALRHQQLTLFFILVIAIGGALAYFKLGQREDPDFTFRAMVIRTLWPGATAEQVDREVTDRIEKKLQETPYFDMTAQLLQAGRVADHPRAARHARAPKPCPTSGIRCARSIGDIRSTRCRPRPSGRSSTTSSATCSARSTPSPATASRIRELRDYVEAVRQRLLRAAERGQDRTGRRAGRTRSSSNCRTRSWRSSASTRSRSRPALQRAERRGAGRHRRDRDAQRAGARHRQFHLGGRPSRHAAARQRQHHPPRRHRPRVPRLCRPAETDHALTAARMRSASPCRWSSDGDVSSSATICKREHGTD